IAIASSRWRRRRTWFTMPSPPSSPKSITPSPRPSTCLRVNNRNGRSAFLHDPRRILYRRCRMFDEPTENPESRPLDPAQRAKEKSDEFRMHAELAATFEGVRKWDARIVPSLDPQITPDAQKTIGKLEKSR